MDVGTMPENNTKECVAQLRRAIMDMSPEEHEHLLDELRDLVDSGDPAQWANSTGEDDEPPRFEGRPERNGGLDRRRIAQDRAMTRRAIAFDAAHDTQRTERARVDFARRFPAAAQIQRV
jgi:hypothetical protein